MRKREEGKTINNSVQVHKMKKLNHQIENVHQSSDIYIKQTYTKMYDISYHRGQPKDCRSFKNKK